MCVGGCLRSSVEGRLQKVISKQSQNEQAKAMGRPGARVPDRGNECKVHK